MASDTFELHTMPNIWIPCLTNTKHWTGLFIHSKVNRRTLCLHAVALWRLADVDSEHDDLGGHGGHLVAEAELVSAVHVCSHRVLPTGLSVSFIDLLPVWTCYLSNELG